MDDSADILGGQLHAVQHKPFFSLAGLGFSGLLSVTILVLAAFYGLQLLYPHYRQYQEKRYRKFMRRKHGIPDHDRRPFNVAYAAAKRAQKEREAEEKGISRRDSSGVSVIGGQAARQPVLAPPVQATRQRQATASSTQPLQAKDLEEIPQQPSTYLESRRTSGQTTTASESEHHTSGIPQNYRSVVRSASSSSMYAPAYQRSGAPGTTRPKRALDDEDAEDETQESKKTRLISEDVMDGVDEEQAADADIDDDMEIDEDSPAQPVRGAKRLASLDEDEGFESSRAIGREKRPRKVAKDDSLLQAMRGKKRDRAEAGSTFGGDDEVEDDAGHAHRSQQRRRIGNKKSAGNLRGRKRGREPESMESDGDDSDSPSRRAARHKRGKRSPREEDWLSDDGMISHDPLCKGRHIGEEWETNGVKYKVGPNGQRLRQTLVKKSRSRFPMPKDSLHPDRSANIDVYVETWLSEEEYQLAKEHNELAWQSPQNSVIELPATTDVPDSPSKGKSLLWSSTAAKEMRKQPLVKSVSANNAVKGNPFQTSQGNLVRRISTIFTPVPTAPESPKLKSAKSYSKWEKQDLEAAAMTRLRERVKSDASVPEKKTVTFAQGHTSIPPSGMVPSFTAKATTSKSEDAAKPSTTFSFAPSTTTSTAQPAKASTSDLPSLTIPTTGTKPAEPAKSFSAPSISSNAAEPGKIPAAAPPTTTPFSFGSAPASQPTTKPSSKPPASTSVPEFFAKPAAPASAPATSLFGGATQPTAQSTTAPNPFGSTAPASSSTPSTQNNAPSSAQPAAKPIFGFGVPSSDASKKPEEKPAQPAQAAASSGGSLLSRMGGFSNPAASSNTATSMPTAPPSQPIFGFSKPVAPASSSAPAPVAPSLSTSSGASAPLKFNFGVTSKPAAAPAAGTMASNSTTTSSADAKPAANFTFGATSTPAATTTTPAEAPMTFGFGGPPSSNGAPIFGNTNGSSAFGGAFAAPKDIPATPNPKSAFAMPKTPANVASFGASTTPAGTPSGAIFGNAAAAPHTPVNGSALGDAMSTTPVGTPPVTSVFGNNAATTTPAGPPPAKSAFASFGNNTASGSSAPLFGNTSKPATSTSTPLFGQTSSVAFPSQPPASSSSTSTFASNAVPAANGTTQGPSGPAAGSSAPKFSFAFGSGNSTSNSTTGASSTAAPTQSKLSFNFASAPTTNGAAPSFGSTAFGSTNGAAGSTAGAGQSTQPTPSMFGFGAPTGSTFAFGQKPPDSSQK